MLTDFDRKLRNLQLRFLVVPTHKDEADTLVRNALNEFGLDYLLPAVKIAATNISYQDIADACGVSRATLYRIVAGKHDTRYKTILKLLDYFGYDTNLSNSK